MLLGKVDRFFMLIEGIEGQDPGSDDENDAPKLYKRDPAADPLGAKQKGFVRSLARNLMLGMEPDAAKLDAVGKNFPVTTARARIKKANALLEKTPAINRALQEIFAEAGFTMADAANKQVELINHEDPFVAQAGLKTYFGLTVPKPTQKLQVQSLGVVEMITRTGNAPKIATRIVDQEDK
jgi:hypothetical protein